MIDRVADSGIRAGNPMNRSVWVGMSKVGSLGMAMRWAVSFHGFALNVNTSLEPSGDFRVRSPNNQINTNSSCSAPETTILPSSVIYTSISERAAISPSK